MSGKLPAGFWVGYCICADTFVQGRVPVVSNGEGRYVVFAAEVGAQGEIGDNQITRLRQFLDGEREY